MSVFAGVTAAAASPSSSLSREAGEGQGGGLARITVPS